MNKSDLKNIVFLKEVNSNIVDEAIIILKPNVKVKESVIEGKNKVNNKPNSNYILNEAQLVVSNYISRMKNDDKNLRKKYEKKYKSMRVINIVMFIAIIGLVISKIF